MLRTTVSPAFKLYGSLIRVWVMIFPFFAILRPEDLQVVLSSRKHTEKIFFYKLLHNFLGNGLITSSGTYKQNKFTHSVTVKWILPSLAFGSGEMEFASAINSAHISHEYSGNICGNVCGCIEFVCETFKGRTK